MNNENKQILKVAKENLRKILQLEFDIAENNIQRKNNIDYHLGYQGALMRAMGIINLVLMGDDIE